MGYFKKLCSRRYRKILKFERISKMGVRYSNGNPVCTVGQFANRLNDKCAKRVFISVNVLQTRDKM